MLDSFDYKEPACALCSGKEFYYPDKEAPLGRIPVNRIIEKIDACFEKNDLVEAKRLLEYWQKEAINLKDLQGELSVLSELVGLYRKTLEKENALNCIDRALELIKKLNKENTVSGATILLNCATTLKCFGFAKKAIPLYKLVENTYKEKLDSDDSLFGGLFNNMALALEDLEKYDEALFYYDKALKIMLTKDNGELESAITYINVACLYEKIEKNFDAKENCEKALALLNDKSITHNGYFAFVCLKCVDALAHFGFSEQADQLRLQAERIYARA